MATTHVEGANQSSAVSEVAWGTAPIFGAHA